MNLQGIAFGTDWVTVLSCPVSGCHAGWVGSLPLITERLRWDHYQAEHANDYPRHDSSWQAYLDEYENDS